MEVVERFVQRSVKLVALYGHSEKMGRKENRRTNGSIGHDGIGYIRKYPPNVAHTPAEFLCPTRTRYQIAFTGIESANKSAHAGPSYVIDGNTIFL
jgi:hypothetical protein